MGTQVVSPRKLARLRCDTQLDIIAAYALGSDKQHTKVLYLRSGQIVSRTADGMLMCDFGSWKDQPAERHAVEDYLDRYLAKAGCVNPRRKRPTFTCTACGQPTEKTYTMERHDHKTGVSLRLVGIPFCNLCNADHDLVKRVSDSLFAKQAVAHADS